MDDGFDLNALPGKPVNRKQNPQPFQKPRKKVKQGHHWAGLPLLDFLEENGLREDFLHLWEGRPSRRERLRREWWLEFKQGFKQGFKEVMTIFGFTSLLYLPQLVLCTIMFNKLEPSLPAQYMGYFALFAVFFPAITTLMYMEHLLHQES